MKEEKFNKWTEVRKKGFLKFVISDGVLLFGAFFFIFTNIFRGFELDKILINLLASVIMGFIWGSLMWYSKDIRYEKELTKRKYRDS